MTTLTHEGPVTKLPVGTWKIDPVHSTFGFSALWGDGITIGGGPPEAGSASRAGRSATACWLASSPGEVSLDPPVKYRRRHDAD